MATETKLRQLAQGGCPVYYFYSSESYLVRQAVARAAKLLAEGEDEETTVLDGAAPEIEQLIMAAGTISFFGTRRVVLLPEVDPAAYSDKDLDELCATLASLENAVVVLGSVFEMERNKLKLGYVDLYRVKLGAAKRKSYSTVFKDFGYKGSDYRLKRSAETASHYTLPQLEACMQILLELDKSLKSQPVSAQTLLETALCRLAMAGGRR